MRIAGFLLLCAASCANRFPVSADQADLARSLIVAAQVPGVSAAAGALSCANGGSCKIFRTAIAAPSGAMGGIAGADNRCNTDSARPNTSQYKALLVDETPVRRASVTANAGDGQLDWVLRANRDYYRPDGTFLFRASAAALIPFPITEQIAVFTGSVWTGITNTWTTGVTLSCTNWGVTTGNGNRGTFPNTTMSAIYNGFGACNISSFYLLCVEQ